MQVEFALVSAEMSRYEIQTLNDIRNEVLHYIILFNEAYILQRSLELQTKLWT